MHCKSQCCFYPSLEIIRSQQRFHLDKGYHSNLLKCWPLADFLLGYAHNTVRCAHGSDQLFPTLLKYVNYEGSWCIETELLFKKMPPYYSSLVIFKKNFFLFQFAKFVKFWKGTSWVRTSSHIGYCNFFSKYNCLVF